MSHLDGIAVIRLLDIRADVFLPILVLTADATGEAKKRALEGRRQGLPDEAHRSAGGDDMVLSDTKMPVLAGERFDAELERRFSALRERIVFVTGDIMSREKREFLERTGAPHILKPFDLREVRQVVHRMLAAAGGAAAGGSPGLR